MGWIGVTKKKSTWEHVKSSTAGEIVRYSTRGGVYYLAVRVGKNRVVGVVVITEQERESNQLRMKILDEGMAPYYYNASAQVLNALSDTTDPYALEWRARCRQKVPLQQKDLRGVRIKLDGHVYEVIGKGHPRARSYQIKHVKTGMYYRLASSQIDRCEYIEG